MSIDAAPQDLARRIDNLTATDAQFAAALPIDEVALAVEKPGLRLPEIVRTVLQAYADRTALGQRSVEFVTENGRTVARLLPTFDTITYRELWDRIKATAAALHADGVKAGDRVALLGFTSTDYTVVDTALGQIGAVSVPLQTSSSSSALRPIIAETEPVLIATSATYVADAAELAISGPAPTRIVVFDHHAQVDDEREAIAAARAALSDAGLDVIVETFADLLGRGKDLPEPPAPEFTDADPLTLLIYTSGSTGAPKGAMYPESNMTTFWRRASSAWFGPSAASINLCFMPMSHVMGRSILYSSLANGGTCYFAAKSDLSTLLEDFALTRPTELNLVPRVWEMMYLEFQSRVDKQLPAGAGEAERDGIEHQVMADMRENLLGDRYLKAMTGSAPITDELKAWVEKFLGIHLLEGYGSTEAGMVFFDGVIQRPPTLEYKLVDVPDLGYYLTDQPYPRGELLVKTEYLFPGYYKRPEVTASVFDEDGFYRTGDVVAELGPDQIQYLDRRNNVLKLAQGEFVTLAKLEAAFSNNSPLVRQIYVYGNSAQPYLLAVVVPTPEALLRWQPAELKAQISESLQEVAKAAELQSYEIPRDFIVETEPFSLENGLLTGIRKLAWPKLKAHYGPALEQLYVDLAAGQAAELRELRGSGAQGPALPTVMRAAGALLGASGEVSADAHFTDLGGDSLSALTFGNLLEEIFGVEVQVGVIVSPANDMAAIAAYIEAERSGGAKRPSFTSVHGKNAVEVRAADLTLDTFIDAGTLAAAPSLPGPASTVRTVLLTGATGFLGRYLALEWLERMDLVGGKVICLVRARSDEEARARLDATFDSGDPKLLAHYRALAADHLEVIAGDKGEANLGLSQDVWQRLADTVDVIVDPAALVNHVLPYSELFGPNALGTAELIRIALTTRQKPFLYVSTIGVGDQLAPGTFVEDADVRVMSPVRSVNDGYANGYGNSKWAGEVLLREANDLCGLPVSVFRCDMILADTSYAGQLNVPDMFSRMMFSLVATGIAPKSFYELDSEDNRQAAHYDGLPVEFIAESISTLGIQEPGAFATYHVMNPHSDGISMDVFVDWLIDAGYSIARVDDYAEWLNRFETTLRGLPDKQRNASLLPLLHNYQKAEHPHNGSMAPVVVFRDAVKAAKLGADQDIPHVTAPVIVKYITDLQLLGLL